MIRKIAISSTKKTGVWCILCFIAVIVWIL